jgi:hypothetical protein
LNEIWRASSSFQFKLPLSARSKLEELVKLLEDGFELLGLILENLDPTLVPQRIDDANGQESREHGRACPQYELNAGRAAGIVYDDIVGDFSSLITSPIVAPTAFRSKMSQILKMTLALISSAAFLMTASFGSS